MADTRRPFLSIIALLAATLMLTGCTALNTASMLLGNQINLYSSQLQRYLDHHYPQRYEQFGGLVAFSVMNPTLAVPQDSTRLHLDFDVGVEGLGRRGDTPAGHFAVTSGLRHDRRSSARYIEEPTLESAELPLVGDRMNAIGRELINGWLRDHARSEPVYRLEQSALDQLGMHRIAGVLIQNGHVVIKIDR